MFRTRRELLSQNFLWNRELVKRLVRNSSISQNDLVLEIGPGRGIITDFLLKACKSLTAVETDHELFCFLKEKYKNNKNLTLIERDFLDQELPNEPYKIFSNIPFSITGEIIKKLLFDDNPPSECYLVVQQEAAEKFAISRGKNSMLAVLFYPWFDIKIVHSFKRTDFRPIPGVNICLLKIHHRETPLLDYHHKSEFRDYVAFSFTKQRSAPYNSPTGWLKNYHSFMESGKGKLAYGGFNKWRREEKNLKKIHRTRIDKNWQKNN